MPKRKESSSDSSDSSSNSSSSSSSGDRKKVLKKHSTKKVQRKDVSGAKNKNDNAIDRSRGGFKRGGSGSPGKPRGSTSTGSPRKGSPRRGSHSPHRTRRPSPVIGRNIMSSPIRPPDHSPGRGGSPQDRDRGKMEKDGRDDGRGSRNREGRDSREGDREGQREGGRDSREGGRDSREGGRDSREGREGNRNSRGGGEGNRGPTRGGRDVEEALRQEQLRRQSYTRVEGRDVFVGRIQRDLPDRRAGDLAPMVRYDNRDRIPYQSHAHDNNRRPGWNRDNPPALMSLPFEGPHRDRRDYQQYPPDHPGHRNPQPAPRKRSPLLPTPRSPSPERGNTPPVLRELREEMSKWKENPSFRKSPRMGQSGSDYASGPSPQGPSKEVREIVVQKKSGPIIHDHRILSPPSPKAVSRSAENVKEVVKSKGSKKQKEPVKKKKNVSSSDDSSSSSDDDVSSSDEPQQPVKTKKGSRSSRDVSLERRLQKLAGASTEDNTSFSKSKPAQKVPQRKPMATMAAAGFDSSDEDEEKSNKRRKKKTEVSAKPTKESKEATKTAKQPAKPAKKLSKKSKPVVQDSTSEESPKKKVKKVPSKIVQVSPPPKKPAVEKSKVKKKSEKKPKPVSSDSSDDVSSDSESDTEAKVEKVLEISAQAEADTFQIEKSPGKEDKSKYVPLSSKFVPIKPAASPEKPASPPKAEISPLKPAISPIRGPIVEDDNVVPGVDDEMEVDGGQEVEVDGGHEVEGQGRVEEVERPDVSSSDDHPQHATVRSTVQPWMVLENTEQIGRVQCCTSECDVGNDRYLSYQNGSSKSANHNHFSSPSEPKDADCVLMSVGDSSYCNEQTSSSDTSCAETIPVLSNQACNSDSNVTTDSNSTSIMVDQEIDVIGEDSVQSDQNPTPPPMDEQSTDFTHDPRPPFVFGSGPKLDENCPIGGPEFIDNGEGKILEIVNINEDPMSEFIYINRGSTPVCINNAEDANRVKFNPEQQSEFMNGIPVSIPRQMSHIEGSQQEFLTNCEPRREFIDAPGPGFTNQELQPPFANFNQGPRPAFTNYNQDPRLSFDCKQRARMEGPPYNNCPRPGFVNYNHGPRPPLIHPQRPPMGYNQGIQGPRQPMNYSQGPRPPMDYNQGPMPPMDCTRGPRPPMDYCQGPRPPLIPPHINHYQHPPQMANGIPPPQVNYSIPPGPPQMNFPPRPPEFINGMPSPMPSPMQYNQNVNFVPSYDHHSQPSPGMYHDSITYHQSGTSNVIPPYNHPPTSTPVHASQGSNSVIYAQDHNSSMYNQEPPSTPATSLDEYYEQWCKYYENITTMYNPPPDKKRSHRDRGHKSHRSRDSYEAELRSFKKDRQRSRRSPSDRSADHRSERGPSEAMTAKEKAAESKKVMDLLTTKTGGAYIPPAKLRAMQAHITDKSSIEYQRIAWESLKKSMNGLVNKVNIGNLVEVVRELLQENIVRGQGALCRSIMQAQAASPTFTHVYAALVAIINTKFPQTGELILKRLVIQFRRGFRRNDKDSCLSSVRFTAHLVNQQVAHEVLALQILTVLLENPTDDSVEVAVEFLKQSGAKLSEVSPKGLNAIFDSMRRILHESEIAQRVQYMVEVMFAIRKDGFKDYPTVEDGLDLVDENDQFTHMLTLDDELQGEDHLNVFKFDELYETNEAKYKALRQQMLEESSSDESGSESSDGEEAESESQDEEAKQTIIDSTETNMVALRRVIYLTIQSSLDFEECTHKILKLELKPGQEVELCNMVLDCCAQLRTYEKFYGLLAQRLCQINRMYIEPMQNIFKEQYETIHRLETDKLRNIARFFSHLLHTEAISWGVLSICKLTEDDTTSASRIFLKILFQELSSFLGVPKLNQRLQDPTQSDYFEGILPHDNPKNTRFAINFFTTIGLGGLTEELRDHLTTSTQKAAQQKAAAEAAKATAEAVQSSSSASDSSDSDSSDSDSDSDSDSSSSEEEAPKKRNWKGSDKKKGKETVTKHSKKNSSKTKKGKENVASSPEKTTKRKEKDAKSRKRKKSEKTANHNSDIEIKKARSLDKQKADKNKQKIDNRQNERLRQERPEIRQERPERIDPKQPHPHPQRRDNRYPDNHAANNFPGNHPDWNFGPGDHMRDFDGRGNNRGPNRGPPPNHGPPNRRYPDPRFDNRMRDNWPPNQWQDDGQRNFSRNGPGHDRMRRGGYGGGGDRGRR